MRKGAEQVIPAEGWFAVIVDIEDETFEYSPLLGWALFRGGDDYPDEMVGLIADRDVEVDEADSLYVRRPGETYGFFEYVHASTLEHAQKRDGLEERIRSFIAGRVGVS